MMTKEVATEVLSRLETLSAQVQTKMWPVLVAETMAKARILMWFGGSLIALAIVSLVASLLLSKYNYREHEVVADVLGVSFFVEFIVGAILLGIGVGWSVAPNFAVIRQIF